MRLVRSCRGPLAIKKNGDFHSMCEIHRMYQANKQRERRNSHAGFARISADTMDVREPELLSVVMVIIDFAISIDNKITIFNACDTTLAARELQWFQLLRGMRIVWTALWFRRLHVVDANPRSASFLQKDVWNCPVLLLSVNVGIEILIWRF
ncbi:hypothetical protein PR003_g11771 [Phytophthora rubi]|uniref:Uncharacterized protein n=1 Tax=Phytophthora rubi TaxID=129364 RepID=A0A6A4F228_9STRA|nr:hypothetical protein PR003_g11771 [Phytophthora rubi]